MSRLRNWLCPTSNWIRERFAPYCVKREWRLKSLLDFSSEGGATTRGAWPEGRQLSAISFQFGWAL